MRARLRRAWSVGDETVVIAVLGDTPARVDAMRALGVVGLAAETGRALRLLVHPRAHDIHRARRVAEAMGHSDRLIEDPQAVEPASALAGADAGLALGGCGERAVAYAMAYGLAIVSEHAHPLLTETGTGLVAADASARALARLVCGVHDEPARRRDLGEAARCGIANHATYRRLVTRVESACGDGPRSLA